MYPGSTFEAQKDLMNRLDPEVKVSMDPGEIYARKGLVRLSPLIQRCHILFLTEKEVTLLTARDLRSGARSLLEAGPKILVCKRGSRGSQIFTESGDFEIPTRAVTVVDNTGAGDVYNAGFLAGFFLRSPLEVCALFATQVASKSITGYGRTCYPNREDLGHFFGLTF
jgi:ribokinase